MKKTLYKFVVAALLFTACNGNTDSYTPPAGAQAAPVILPDQAAVNPAQQNLSNPMPAGPVIIPQSAPVAATTARGMNPAHGQPNHRCDIAVGAPLDSPTQTQPASTQNAATSTQPVLTPVANAPQKIVTKPGMNPPHGEPNHRCDIAVGAPLSSAPVQNKIDPVKKDSGTK